MSINNLFTGLNGEIIQKMPIDTWTTIINNGGAGGGAVDSVVSNDVNIVINPTTGNVVVSLNNDINVNQITTAQNTNPFTNVVPAQGDTQYLSINPNNNQLSWAVGQGVAGISNVVGTAEQIISTVNNNIASISLSNPLTLAGPMNTLAGLLTAGDLTCEGNLSISNFTNPWNTQPTIDNQVLACTTDGVLEWVNNNVGVATLAGTANQINVNNPTGDVILSFPNDMMVDNLELQQLTITGTTENLGIINNPFQTSVPPANGQILSCVVNGDVQTLEWVENNASGVSSLTAGASNNIVVNQNTGAVTVDLAGNITTNAVTTTVLNYGGVDNCFTALNQPTNGQVLSCVVNGEIQTLQWINNGGGGGAVNSVNGSANQIIANPTSGDVSLSLAENLNVTQLTVLGQGDVTYNPFMNTGVVPQSGSVLTAVVNGQNNYIEWSTPSNINLVNGTNTTVNVNGGNTEIDLNADINLDSITCTTGSNQLVNATNILSNSLITTDLSSTGISQLNTVTISNNSNPWTTLNIPSNGSILTANTDNSISWQPAPNVNNGTFTPTLSFGGGSVGITYSEQIGFWQISGNVLTFSLTFGLTNKGTSTGQAIINGFPNDGRNGILSQYLPLFVVNLQNPSLNPYCYLQENNSQLFLINMDTNSGSNNLDDTNFTNTSFISFNGSVFIN